jgi:hypothetical protein
MHRHVDLEDRPDVASLIRQHSSLRERLRRLERRLHGFERHSSEHDGARPSRGSGLAVVLRASAAPKSSSAALPSHAGIGRWFGVWREDLEGLSRLFSEWIARLDEKQRNTAGNHRGRTNRSPAQRAPSSRH